MMADSSATLNPKLSSGNHQRKNPIGALSMVAVIATHGRQTLLRRTLHSLAQAARPAGLREIVVVENGEKGDAEQVVAESQGELSVRYLYSPPANKSRALNFVLDQVGDEFLIFFDDDIRVDPGIFAAYEAALRDGVDAEFMGGRCRIDYEEEPAEWLKAYLPPSAVGWELGDERQEVRDERFLGCNWGAKAEALRRLGGFDETKGPGTRARGQESTMQDRLVEAGSFGLYLPDAIAWHYVPKGRCSSEWALNRIEQTAAYRGSVVRAMPLIKRWARVQRVARRAIKARLALALRGRRMGELERFGCEYKMRRWVGFQRGLSDG